MSDNSTKSSKKSIIQKVFIVGSGLAFLGMMTLPMLDMFKEAPEQTQATSPNTNPQEQLNKIADGYEKVLKREPNNPTALQGLAEVRLKMNDLKGAIAPMEKLVALYPNDPTALQGLAEVRLKMNDLKGAIAPMEKLVALYPERKDIKELLDAIKQQVKTGKAPSGVGQPAQPTQPNK
jgi:cytochrome c-type biogenesis protein CcmH/NrfG